MADHIIINSEAVIKALAAAPDRLIEGIKPAVERWQLKRVAELARYPGKPAGSRYRRTGTLGRTWTAARPSWSASRGAFESKLGNSTPYASYVQGERQARQNSHWRKAEEIAQGARSDLEADVRAAAEATAAQINGATA